MPATGGWLRASERFGQAPAQILHEWNSVTHVSEYEGQPGRRPLTYEEVQSLFDAADGRVEEMPGPGPQGRADRDAGFGAAEDLITPTGCAVRRGCGLDLADLRRNAKAPDYGRYGALFIRWGKSSNGSPPKRRTVFTVPEMDWVVGVLDHYLTEVRPRFEAGQPSGAVGDRAVRPVVQAQRERGVRDCPRGRRAARPNSICTACGTP